METIPEGLVEETWQEVADFPAEHGDAEMKRFCENQPELVAFMLEFSQGLDHEVKELAIYMLFVIYRIFEKSAKHAIRQISAEEIINCYDSNEKLVVSLEGAHERFLDRIARVHLATQPHVMGYILETLMEGSSEEEESELNDDIGYLFLLLKTIVDVLDYSTRGNLKTPH
ncbi:MAG: hypothetical protein J7J91_05885 [Deltaproteobacteria bacterium]|nr:hypothetical protein [Deltaproteobacteria bacterium]HDN67928.1 hypothetical protein [Bacillota bacterium]MCD6138094.1 hypothetical protein [Deltaproteobacteria bacterium]RLB88099.1 MAG: hypothetical protein DRH10_08125 [Deltaproteobacteria bacterium]RLB92238.1 MAG: hypothetical protein DRH50_10040 [Deltaproteobacteria bacterium]